MLSSYTEPIFASQNPSYDLGTTLTNPNSVEKEIECSQGMLASIRCTVFGLRVNYSKVKD